MKKLALVLLTCLLALPVFGAEVPPFAPAAEKATEERIVDTAALHAWLSSFEGLTKSTPFTVEIPAEKLTALATHQPTGGPLWVGVTTDVGFSFNTLNKVQPLGSVHYADGSMVWTAAFSSPGASGVRLHLDEINLPAEAQLYVYGRHGHAFGPYAAGESLSTNAVAGDEIVLQLHMPLGGKSLAAGFQVASLTHLGDRYSFGTSSMDKAFCSWNDSCITNAECENIPNAVQVLQDAAAYLLFDVNGSTYLCTGGLLADTSNSATPYLLSANHCFSTQSTADTLEAYFQWTVACGEDCGNQYFPPGTVPRTLGATLLATDSKTDFTLVQLSEAAPSGSAFLGWTTTDVANSEGTQLYRVSHPKGSPQAYSEQQVNTTAGTCRTLPRGDFIYSDATLADTEGGSSGSPVVNGNGQVVGQLYGACGSSPSTTCDNDDRTVDGAFAVTYSSVAQWLDPGSGPTCADVGASCSSDSDCCSNKCKGRSGAKTCK